MKRSINCAFGSFFLIASLFCGQICGQTTTATQAVGDPPGAGGDPPQTQPPTTPRTIRTDETFFIGNDDVLAISVWNEPNLTKQIPVRSDGKISLPLIGDIQAAGRTPSQLEIDITDKLKGYIADPQVAVIVQQINSLKFNILGEVIKPGAYPLTAGTTIVDAIAIAGGFKDFAKKKGVYVLRPSPGGADMKYNFNYQEFIKGKNTKQNIMVKPRDTIIVP